MRLGIAEAAVELEQLDAVLGDDQAAVEHATVLDAASAQGLEHRTEEVLGHGLGDPGVEAWHRAVAAHAAGVRPLVVGEDALVVLGRRHGHDGVPSHSASSETSGPLRNSSISTVRPASPNAPVGEAEPDRRARFVRRGR